MRGEGRGVTSAIALSMGEERAELGADPRFELLPILLAKIVFILGVRASGTLIDCVFCECLTDSGELRRLVLVLAAVTGVMSVCIRSPVFKGFEIEDVVSIGRRWDFVSRVETSCAAPNGFEAEALGGGDGAIVVDLNNEWFAEYAEKFESFLRFSSLKETLRVVVADASSLEYGRLGCCRGFGVVKLDMAGTAAWWQRAQLLSVSMQEGLSSVRRRPVQISAGGRAIVLLRDHIKERREREVGKVYKRRRRSVQIERVMSTGLK